MTSLELMRCTNIPRLLPPIPCLPLLLKSITYGGSLDRSSAWWHEGSLLEMIILHLGDFVRGSLLESVVYRGSVGSFVTLETWSEDCYLSWSSIEDPLDHLSPWQLVGSLLELIVCRLGDFVEGYAILVIHFLLPNASKVEKMLLFKW